jgi:hypothetical protein
MAEVAIHFDDEAVIALQRPPEARQISWSKPFFFRPVQDMYMSMPATKLIG